MENFFPGGADETLEVVFRLLLNALVEESADLGVFFERLIDFCGARIGDDFFHDQRVQLRVLRLLEPVILEQTLELGVEVLVVAHALDVMAHGDPLDVQDRHADPQRAVREHEPAHVFGRTDEVAMAAEAVLEFLAEALEEVDVLRLLAGELEQRAHPVVVPRSLGRAWSTT